MPKRALFLAAALSLCQIASGAETWVIRRGMVRVRAGAGPFTPIVDRVKRKTEIAVIDSSGRRWLKASGIIVTEDGERKVVPFKGAAVGWVPKLGARPLVEGKASAQVAPISMEDVTAMRVDVMAAIRGLNSGVIGMMKAEKLDPELAKWIAAPKFRAEDYVRFLKETHPQTAARDLTVKGEEQGLADADPEVHEAAGEVSAAAMAQDLGSRIVADVQLNRYVNLVAALLGQVSSRYDLLYRVIIVNDKSVNSYSLPGGYIAITTGLLSMCQDEAELAGALAHEIAHVARDHGLQQAKKQMGEIGAFNPAFEGGMDEFLKKHPGMFDKMPEEFKKATRSMNQLLALYRNIGYSRKRLVKEEREADFYALVYLVRAGYDPDGLRRLVDRIGRQFGYDKDQMMSVHDSPRRRLDYIVAFMRHIGATPLPNRTFAGRFKGEVQRLAAGGLKFIQPPARPKEKPPLDKGAMRTNPDDPFAELDRVFGEL